jgi:hypothetical protein
MSSPYAASIESQEASNTIHQNGPWIWVDNTSRDEVVGGFFGLAVAYDLVDDATIRSRHRPSRNVAARLYLSSPMVGPNDDITSTFLIRPEELQMLVQVARHVNPSNDTSAPFYTPPISMPVLYAGASPGLTGLDQVNISLASNLSGSGESNVILTVDGRYPIQSRSTFNKVLRVSSHPQFRCHR